MLQDTRSGNWQHGYYQAELRDPELLCQPRRVQTSRSGRKSLSRLQEGYRGGRNVNTVGGDETTTCRSIQPVAIEQSREASKHPLSSRLQHQSFSSSHNNCIWKIRQPSPICKRLKGCKPLSSATLYKMIIGVTEALLYLHQQLNLVHRATMAENILVGDGYVAKLSGMHSLGVLQYGINKDGKIGQLSEFLFWCS